MARRPRNLNKAPFFALIQETYYTNPTVKILKINQKNILEIDKEWGLFFLKSRLKTYFVHDPGFTILLENFGITDDFGKAKANDCDFEIVKENKGDT